MNEINNEEKQNDNKRIIIFLILIIIGLVGFIVYDKIISKDNVDKINVEVKEENKNEVIKENKDFSINMDLIEKNIKIALTKKVPYTSSENAGTAIGLAYTEAYYDVVAEGHKTLGTELKENKIYVYVLGYIQAYKTENGKYESGPAVSAPFVLIFDKDYEFESYLMPEDGDMYFYSLKKIYPTNLAEQAINEQGRWIDDNVNEQINSYLK